MGNLNAADLGFTGEFNFQKFSAGKFLGVKQNRFPVAVLARTVKINFLLCGDLMKILAIVRNGEFQVMFVFREKT